MADDATGGPARASTAREVVLRRRDPVIWHDRHLERAQTRHRRYAAATPAPSAWAGFSDQRHVRAIAVDPRRGWVWLATWGGVLCWLPAVGLCVRHGSEHGLVGNATRAVVVDGAGVVWAAGQGGALCSLDPGEPADPEGGPAWRPVPGLDSWRVERLAPRPAGGVDLALRDDRGLGALGTVAGPGAAPGLVAEGGTATEEVAALAGDDGGLWVGNAWGLHRVTGAGGAAPPVLRERVRALAADGAGGLWVGTAAGLHRLRPGAKPEPPRRHGWPEDEVLALGSAPGRGDVWVATARTIGRVQGESWTAGRAGPAARPEALAAAEVGGRARVWVGGAAGLHEVGETECRPAFGPAPEDGLGNAVQCLHSGNGAVWVGLARGLARVDGEGWHPVAGAAAESGAAGRQGRDVRALAPAAGTDRLWVGTWGGGIGRVRDGVFLPGQDLAEPVVALAAEGGTVWAASPGAVFRLAPGAAAWEALGPAPRGVLGAGVIRALCVQPSPGGTGEAVLWVGTSAGLLGYRPAADLWQPASEWGPTSVGTVLARTPITALAADPDLPGEGVWVGTAEGLFGGPPWRRYGAADVRALAVAPAPDRALWVGTGAGLERWDRPGAAGPPGPRARTSPADAGLPAGPVTALAVHSGEDGWEVWVGSPGGLSRYRQGSADGPRG